MLVTVACAVAALSACTPPRGRLDGPVSAAVSHEWTEPLTGMTFVRIDPGCFVMGSAPEEAGREEDEGPRRRVCVDGFWLGKHEVTVAQYRRYLDATTGGTARSFRCDDPRCPVVDVSWFDASGMARWLAAAGRGSYRLPTEAEWEYAARAGGTTAYAFGDAAAPLGRYGWFKDNSEGRAHPVGEKLPNAWGLHDMHGNVSEWVADWYDVYPSGPEGNPAGPAIGDERARRGGAWSYGWPYLRSAFRYADPPLSRRPHVGFRLLREA